MRLLHTMLRVGDLQRSIDFYTRVLGMRVLRQSENTEYKYTLAFVGYTDESEGAVIELTYNWASISMTSVMPMVILRWALMTQQRPANVSAKMAAT